MGNFTISVREHTIFPEVQDEELKDIFGMAITVVTNVKNKDEAKALIAHLGFPLKKEAETKQKAKRKRAEKKPLTA
jgi:large subunit ribosomal protein L5